MNKRSLSIILPLLLIVGAVSIFLYLQSDERKVKNYVEDKYGFDVDIKDKSRTGIASDTEYTVSPVDHEDLEFTVTLPYSEGQITDNYENALETDKELHQLETEIKEIKNLGFTDYYNDDIKAGFVEKKNADTFKTVYIGAGSPIEISQFEEKELDRFYRLQKLVKQSRAAIDRVIVSDMVEPVDTSIVLEMKHLKDVNTKEEFLLQLRRSNWELTSYYENEQWEAEKEKVENDRFTFGSEYSDYWFNCRVTNEKGDKCTNILVSVYYEENGLTKSNPNLEKDLNSIFKLFEGTIAPKATVEYRFIEEGTNTPIGYNNYQISEFGSTSEFIDEAF